MAYSPDGTSLLVSATMNGQSDIFLYHLQSKTFEQITKDIFDDQNQVLFMTESILHFLLIE